MGLQSRFKIWASKHRALLPYIVAQAKLETNNFRSNVYMTDNNMFGMKVGSSGTPGLMSPEGDRYEHYEHDTASLMDMLGWLERKNFPLSVSSADEYAIEMQKREFFTAGLSSYQENLKKWLA